MTPREIAAELARRLHRRNVEFRTADLEAFAAGLPPQLEGETEAEALADRFVLQSRQYASDARGKRNARRLLRDGLLLFLAGAALVAFWTAALVVDQWVGHLPGGLAVAALMGVVLMGGVTLMIVGVLFLIPALVAVAWTHLRSWGRAGGQGRGED